LRGEGFTEQTADILLVCTSGDVIAPGGTIPLANITIFYNVAVTSRLLPAAGDPSLSNASEALLLIDEPGAGYSYESSLPQVLCTTPLMGCTATVGAETGPTYGTAVSSGSTPAPNVYQGLVNGNSVTFYGVPVLPPGATGIRFFRIINVRVNAQTLAGVPAPPPPPVQATIMVSQGMSLPSGGAAIVGFVSNGLTASAGSPASLPQGISQAKTQVNMLTFAENFGSAFKTRVFAQGNTLYAGQIDNPVQNIPGGVFYSESDFVFPTTGTQPGLADFGTRLKATFHNVPPGVRLFVSTSNVNNDGSPVAVPSPVGGATADFSPMSPAYVGYAQLVNGEATSDGDAGTPGTFPAMAATDTAAGNVPIAEVAISNNGIGTAVWEAVNTNPSILESLKFAVYVTYTANVAQNLPSIGTATVNLSFAATADSGVAGDATVPLPRFVADVNAAAPVFSIQTSNPTITVDTMPSGRAITVDGTPYTAPHTFSWAVGSSHSIGTSTPQAGSTGTRYVFASWSVGGANPQSITVPNSDMTYTANFNTEYLLTTNVNPAAGGTITAGGWFGAGAAPSISASANAGYQFAGFSGNLSGLTTPQPVTMNAPRNVVANFATLAPILTAGISNRTGTAAARQWTLALANNGLGTANAAQITGVVLTQTSGAACTPVISSPTPPPSVANPLAVGTIAPSASGTAGVTVNFTGCAATARFRVVISFTANSNSYSGSTTLNNQFY